MLERITELTIKQENGDTWVLTYYLTRYPGSEGEDLFGLQVNKCFPDGRLAESEETGAITDTRAQALEVVNAFAAGTVPPCTLLEMVDDWVFTSQPQSMVDPSPPENYSHSPPHLVEADTM